MKARKFLSVLLTVVVMMTSLLCCGVSASASTGKYPGAVWARNTLYVDGNWYDGDEEVWNGYYCVRIGNYGSIDYLQIPDAGSFAYLYAWLWIGGTDGYDICIQSAYDSTSESIRAKPYIYTAEKDGYYYQENVIYYARNYYNNDDDTGVTLYIPKDSPLLDTLASCKQVKISSAYVTDSNEYYDYRVTVSADFQGLKTDVKEISTLTFGKISDKSYTGKALKPAVTIKDGDKKLVSGTDYTVSYKNNTKIGTATVTITGKGDYTGTKTLTFKIVPKKTTLSIKENSTSKVTLSWKKSTGAAGYQIYCSTNGGSYKKLATVKSASTLSKVFSNLNTDKNVYKFRIRPYAKSGSKTVYGSWSNIVSAG